MSYKAMRKKMEKGVTGTGGSDPSPSGGVSPSSKPKANTEESSVSFRAGPNDPPVIKPAKGMPKGE